MLPFAVRLRPGLPASQQLLAAVRRAGRTVLLAKVTFTAGSLIATAGTVELAILRLGHGALRAQAAPRHRQLVA